MCAGEHHTHVVTSCLLGDGCLAKAVGDCGELIDGEDIEATLLPLGDNEALRELIAETGREDDSALLIQLGFMGAEEHQWLPLTYPLLRLNPPI